MATNIFIGVSNTQGIVDQPATVAATTQSKDAELNILTANIPDRETVLLAIEKIRAAVVQANWPPL